MPTFTSYRSWKFVIRRGEDDRWADTISAYPNQGLFRPETLTIYVEPGLSRPTEATWIIRGHWLNSRGQTLGATAFLSSRTERRAPPPWAKRHIEYCVKLAQRDFDHMENGAALAEAWEAGTEREGTGHADGERGTA